MASAHGFSRSLRLVERRAPAPLALPAPPGHVPQPLPPPAAPARRRRSALPMLWALLGACFVGFLGTTTLIDHTGGGSQEFVHAVPLGTIGATTPGDGSLRSLRTSLARMIIPAAAPPTARSVLPPDIRETGLAAPMERDDTTTSLTGLVAALNAPAIDVGPFGEALPPVTSPSPATATWTGAIGGVPIVAALPPGATLGPSSPEPGDEPEDDDATTATLPPGTAPPPPPAAPRRRSATPRQNEPPRAPRIVMRQDAPPPAGSGARLIHPPPPSRTASIGPTIPLPPLPEPRAVGVARPVPPPDGFATQVAATTPAAGASWMRFARPFDRNDVRPRIAVVVIDLGLTPSPTDHAIHYLPGAITLAFSPFADGLPRWVELARRAGHEVLMHLPLESPTAAAVGSEAPAAPAASAENLGRLDWALNRATGYVGVASFMNVAGGEPALRPILTTLRDRGFLYVDRQGSPRAASARLASEIGIPRASADREIDAEPTREAIDQRLAELERMAREAGTAVAIARPLALSFERLSIWSTTLETKGIALAPITAVLNRQRNR